MTHIIFSFCLPAVFISFQECALKLLDVDVNIYQIIYVIKKRKKKKLVVKLQCSFLKRNQSRNLKIQISADTEIEA